MNDINCPYCGAGQYINHDDGCGYEEDTLHDQECSYCEKSFVFTTAIHFFYEAKKADCLNGAEHKYKPTMTVPRRYTKMECPDCGTRRQPTEAELASIMDNHKDNQSTRGE